MIPKLSTEALRLFFKANFLLTFLFFLPFLFVASEPSTLWFALAAALSTAALLYLILYLPLRPLFLFPKAALGAMLAIFLLLDFALLFDFFIYRLWKFHINAMVLNILTSPAAFDSIQTGTAPWLVAGAYLLLFGAVQWFLIRFLQKKASALPRLNRLFNRTLLPLVIVVAIFEKVFYGFAEIYAKDEILESVQPIPFYQPLTFSRFARKYLGIEKRERHAKSVAAREGKIRFPLKPIRLERPDPRHIFIFLFDATRGDMITPEVTPNVWQLARESIFYPDNRSGGNATRFGFFSLIYGLNAPYWFSFLHAQKGAPLFDVLKRLDYQIGIFFSTDTRWPEFRQTAFLEVKEAIVDRMPGNPWQKDRELAKRWEAWIRRADPSRPIFSLVFFDAPHGMTYPKEAAPFQPDGRGEVNYITANASQRRELLNQYRNAIHYDDALFGRMVASLKRLGLYDEAIVAFTSDHGQEFFEHGFLGHNSAFDREQTNSPVILKVPGQPPTVVRGLASSVDLIPSIMRRIGVANPFGDFSNAKADMTRPESYERGFATCGQWYKNAVITPRYTFVFSNLPNEIFKTKVYDTETYRRVPYPKGTETDRVILEVLEQNRRFIR